MQQENNAATCFTRSLGSENQRVYTTPITTGCTSLQSFYHQPSPLPSNHLGLRQIDASPILDRRLMHQRGYPLLYNDPSIFVRQTNRSLRKVLSRSFSLLYVLPRSIALSTLSLAPARSLVSSLPPPARAYHVLLSRFPLSGMRPLATVRNSCCACTTNRRASIVILVDESSLPLPDFALARPSRHPSLARGARLPPSHSLSRPCRSFSLARCATRSCCACATQSTRSLPLKRFPPRLLYLPSRST